MCMRATCSCGPVLEVSTLALERGHAVSAVQLLAVCSESGCLVISVVWYPKSDAVVSDV
jgi:hypothetical protein